VALPTDFVTALAFVHPKEIVATVQSGTWPKGGGPIEMHNEVRPVDLFCYLWARFGPPNGIQNFLRGDHSDNLIHWEWTLRHPQGIATFQGMNFRSEVWLHGFVEPDDSDRDALAAQLKADFARIGKEMKAVRDSLEHWTEFVNPYQRIRRAVIRLLDELDALHLDPESDRIDDMWALADEAVRVRWDEARKRYAEGFSISFAIRSMLPILAESYVNLVLFAMMRPEFRSDDRLRENVVRQPIDVRIKSLSINCTGFARQPDYSTDLCRRYHRLVNERNDLLHGNVVIDKLAFNDVYFLERVPIFREYRSLWQRSLDIEMKAVGLAAVRQELETVDGLIAYIDSCMEEGARRNMALIASAFVLGINQASGHLGLLFPDHLVDSRAGQRRAAGPDVVSKSDSGPA
jgi:hypothetical protein